MLTVQQVNAASGLFGPLPLDGDLSLLGGLQPSTESVYITCGDQEMFMDHTLEFSEAIRRRNPGLELRVEVAAGEVHDWLVLEGTLGVVGSATRRMRRWALNRLRCRTLD